MKLYPFSLYAHNKWQHVYSPPIANAVWRRIRDCTWYAVDCEVTGPSSIILKVYGIADSVTGGIGEKIKEIEVTEFTESEKVLLHTAIVEYATGLAEQEFEVRENHERQQKIIALRKELFFL